MACRVVESVGEGVRDMKAGDHVVPIFTGKCGDCSHCRSDKTNLCARFRVDPLKSVMVGDGRTRFWLAGRGGGEERRPVYHFLNTSTFAEYTVLESACVVKIDPRAPLNRMCLLSCCISTETRALLAANESPRGEHCRTSKSKDLAPSEPSRDESPPCREREPSRRTLPDFKGSHFRARI